MADRSYGREYTYAVDGVPQARIREGTTIENGTVVRFVRQVEYRIGGNWCPVVRYDHGPAPSEHDVRDEGLHIDVYRDSEKDEQHSRRLAPPESAARALTRAEDHLIGHLIEHINRFEQWHDLNPETSGSKNP